VSRASLVETYIAGLNLTAVAIVSDGRRCRITEGEPPPGETIKRQFYFKSSHAELILATIDQEGVTDQAPAALAAQIEQAAATLGAPFQTPDEIQAEAVQAVAEVQARVADLNQSGALKDLNKSYKAYRLRQIARAEKAMPY
jgi:hypothetical protein